MFVGHLAQQGLAYQTIKVYLSAVRNLHVSAGLHNEFVEQLTPRLEMVLKGIKKDKEAANPRTRLPITVEIMEKLRGKFNKKPTDHNNIMMWAACSLAFFLASSGAVNSQCHHKKNTRQPSIYLSRTLLSIAVSHLPGSRSGTSSLKRTPLDRAVPSVWGKREKTSALLVPSYHTWQKRGHGSVHCLSWLTGFILHVAYSLQH